MTIGHKLGLRLFLEGVEVPVIGAQVSIAANSPASASIQVVATDKVLELHPRTLVHLFFYDFVSNPMDYKDYAERSGLKTGQTADVWNDAANSQYKLLFVGELQAIQIQKNEASRAAVLQCVDLSNYWDTTYQYNFKGSLLGGRRHAAFIGANANFFTSPLGHGVGTISALLNGRSANYPELRGLLAGIVRCLEAIGGSYYGYNTFKGANDFTSIAELRLKILQQITAAEKDSSTRKLFARKAFNMWMNRQMGSLGKLVTFRGIVNILQRFIFHEVYPCPVARYVPKVKDVPGTLHWSVDITKDPRTRTLVKWIKRIQDALQAGRTNLRSANGRSVHDGTRTDALVGAFADLKQADLLMRNKVRPAMAGLAGLKTVGKFVRVTAAAIQSARKKLGNSPFNAKLHKSSVLYAASNKVDEALDAIAALLQQRNRKSKAITYDKQDRLNNQILRPDIWFAPPPRCNVLFPELYGHFTWSRNFMREVSRLELQTTHEILGDDALFNGRYYAPNVIDMRKGLRLSSRRFGRLIMAHELMTGIIPMFEKLSEANLFAMKSRKVKYKGAKVSYAQRAVNFQYFKHRFAARSMQASGRFNPWFVPGFPSLLIDRPMDARNLAISGLDISTQLTQLDIEPATGMEISRAQLLQELIPTQYQGVCGSLTHAVNQQGGNTSYGFMQARVHRESTEFLGVDKKVISKKIGTVSGRPRVYGALPPQFPRVGGRGPRGGRVTSVRVVTSEYSGRKVWRLRQTTSARGYVEIDGKTSDGQQVPYEAIRITEQYARRRRDEIDLPIEEAVRPPWVWDGWHNLKIGETYLQFFGTNSITDVDGATAADLATTLGTIGDDIAEAALEVNEGYTHGTGKKIENEDTHQSRKKEDKAQNKPVKNKAGKSTDSAPDEKTGALTIFAIENERTIENAVDYLVRLYSYVKVNGMDVGGFIRNYTWRPVATMNQILGSSDFELTEQADGTYKASGIEGFHSRAFSDESDLFGLVDPKVKKILGLSKEKSAAAAKKMDVRGRRRAVVVEYVNELTNSRGLLG